MRRALAFSFLSFVVVSGAWAKGLFLEAGSMFQNSDSLYGTGDTASVNGKYAAATGTMGYASKTWYAGATLPYASRSANTKYYYQDINQTITDRISDSGVGDPSFWAGKDIFGGNRYAPIVTLTASTSAPVGKTALSLQTWQARPGVALEYPWTFLIFSLRGYAAIPFAPKAAVENQYHAYGGAIFTTGFSISPLLLIGMDWSYAAGDFIRSNASLRFGAHCRFAIPATSLSVNMGAQAEVVRDDRDIFAHIALRYDNISF